MAAKKKNKQNNIEQITKPESTKPFIYGIDLTNFNINAEWINKINSGMSFKACYNVLLITTIFLAQLTVINGFSTELAMKSEIHSTVMRILNSEEITSFISAIVIGTTEKYSTQFKTNEIIERYRVLRNLKGARNSRFNNVIPSIGMKPDALLKYCIGFRFSINGILSTHPIFYSTALFNSYKLKSPHVELKDIKNLTEYKNEFDSAVLFIQTKIVDKNPHLENTESFDITALQQELSLYVESTQSKKDLELLPEDEGTEEERQRARLINEQILKNNKSK